jgi:hypothetical protein
MRDYYQIIRRIVKRNPLLNKVYSTAKQSVINNVINTHIGEITPFSPRMSRLTGKRLNLLVPSINLEHVFGGISTAIKFFEELVENIEGCKMRIILTDAGPTNYDEEKFKDFIICQCDADPNHTKLIVPFNDRYNKTIPVSKDDIFLATSWWTAYAAQRVAGWQAEHYNQDPKKLIYFIQDFEPGFYSWSSQYALAESTYRYNGPQIGVFNSSLLKDFFHNHKFDFSEAYYFEPKLNDHLKKHFLEFSKRGFEKKKRILIYGRPSVPRNAFTLIVEALRLWVWKCPTASEWELVSAGEAHPEIPLGNGVNLLSKGKMTLDEYATTLRESAIGISMMISPHPSYPPLEMAHFGAMVLTNHYENKNLSNYHPNIISLEVYSPDKICDQLCKLCLDFDVNYNFLNNEKSKMPSYFDDSRQFEFIDSIINSIF